MKKGLDLSICVPAFNEENSLAGAVEDLLKTLAPAVAEIEIIIVDDGSRDATLRIAENIAREDPRVKLIHHFRRMGLGVCYRDALAVAGGEYFTWFPADRENSAEEILRGLTFLDQGTAVTSHHQGMDNRHFARRILSRAYTFILNRYFRLQIKYYNGLTVFPAAVVRVLPLRTRGFGLPAESLIRAIGRGCRIIELSAPLRADRRRRSKSIGLWSLAQSFRDLFLILSGIKRNVTRKTSE